MPSWWAVDGTGRCPVRTDGHCFVLLASSPAIWTISCQSSIHTGHIWSILRHRALAPTHYIRGTVPAGLSLCHATWWNLGGLAHTRVGRLRVPTVHQAPVRRR